MTSNPNTQIGFKVCETFKVSQTLRQPNVKVTWEQWLPRVLYHPYLTTL